MVLQKYNFFNHVVFTLASKASAAEAQEQTQLKENYFTQGCHRAVTATVAEDLQPVNSEPPQKILCGLGMPVY